MTIKTDSVSHVEDILALLQDRPALDVDIEQVQFLVPLGNRPPLVYPEDSVLDLVVILTGFMNANVYGQR